MKIETVRAIWRHPEFRTGIHEMAAVALGIAAWGLMTGVAMVKSGLSLTEVILMGVFVFAGSSQLAALPLLVSGAPMWVIIATSVCVNLRFVVFSIHLRPYVMHQSIWRRMFSAYGMADLNYVLFTRRFRTPAADCAGIEAQDAYWLGSCGTCWVSWVGASMLGVALASSIPVSWGLGFAGILALLGIMCSLINSPLKFVSAFIAGAAAVACFALPLKLNILVAIASGVVICLMAEKLALASRASRREEKADHERY